MNLPISALATILFFLTITARAQTLSFGLESGLISSKSSYYKVTDLSNRRNDYFAGLNVNYQFSNRFSINSGLHYLKQGARRPAPDWRFYIGAEEQFVIRKIDYLAIPLTLNAFLGPDYRIITTIGFYGAFNIRAKDYGDAGSEFYKDYVSDISHWTEEFNFGGIIGAGYRLFSSDKFECNAMIKYYQGISNTDPKIQYLPRSQNRYSSALITVGVNYKIPVKVASAGKPDSSEF